jgi:hypothetical protein
MIPIFFDLYSFYNHSLLCYSPTASGNEWNRRKDPLAVPVGEQLLQLHFHR